MGAKADMKFSTSEKRYVDLYNRKMNYMLLNKICFVTSHHHLGIYNTFQALALTFKHPFIPFFFILLFWEAVKFQRRRGFKAFVDRPNLVIMWNNVFWKGPRAYYFTGWKPLRWPTLPTWPLCKQLFHGCFFFMIFSSHSNSRDHHNILPSDIQKVSTSAFNRIRLWKR